MKKILILASLFATFAATAQTYPGIPMFGTSTNQDNTGRSLTYGTATVSDSLGSTVDTVTLIPKHYQKYYFVTLKDSCALAIKSTLASYTGDHMELIISAPAIGGKIYFCGNSSTIAASQWKLVGGATSVSPTASHTLIISFVCDGVAWKEESRSQD